MGALKVEIHKDGVWIMRDNNRIYLPWRDIDLLEKINKQTPSMHVDGVGPIPMEKLREVTITENGKLRFIQSKKAKKKKKRKS